VPQREGQIWEWMHPGDLLRGGIVLGKVDICKSGGFQHKDRSHLLLSRPG